jgi:hypothetical protein
VLPRAWIGLTLALAALGGCGDDDDGGGPSTGAAAVPPPRITELGAAARAAGCRLESSRTTSNAHTADIEERIRYATNPPSSGRHFQSPAEDGIYDEAPPDSTLVHSQEHGRVVIWFKPDLPQTDRAGLRALVEEDAYQLLLVPRAEMPFDVAATAWNAEPGEFGTGRLLGCPSFGPKVYDALRTFRDEHRSRGPEPIP